MTPYIGSKTLDYPIHHYILHKAGTFELKSYDIPENNALVSNISKNSSLEKAFHFIPGQKFRLNVSQPGEKETQLDWEVQIDALNNMFIFCEKSKSRAYFRNDGDIHYFTHFEGNRSSLLFKFFLGAYKVMMGYYSNLLVKDNFPVNTFNNWIVKLGQDFIAPFWIFSHSEFTLRYLGMDDALMHARFRLQSVISAKIGNREIKKMECELLTGPHGLEQFVIRENEKEITVNLVNDR
jgi:hypothetical protein